MSGAQQQEQQQHQILMEEFRAGVTACLRSWSALRAAIQSGWGGVESSRKAELLRDEIYKHFDGTSFPPKEMDIWDLEDALAIYMEEEFSITLEDDSEKQIAECIWNMYEDCSKGDVTLCRRIVQSAEAIEAQMNSFPVQVLEEDDMEDDDDDVTPLSGTDGAISSCTAAQAYASGALFAITTTTKPAVPPKPVRQLGEQPPEAKPKVQVDDEGFAAIPTKQKRNRNP